MSSTAYTYRPGSSIKWDNLSGVIEDNIKEVIREETFNLRDDIKAVWPVKTGRSKMNWYIRGNRYGWSIVNPTINPKTGFHYIPFLWFGGSKQLPLGGDPIVRARAAILLSRFKRLKWNARRRRYDPIKTRRGDLRV